MRLGMSQILTEMRGISYLLHMRRQFTTHSQSSSHANNELKRNKNTNAVSLCTYYLVTVLVTFSLFLFRATD